MQKNLKSITDNRTYKILYKKLLMSSCLICQKRAGSFYASCDGKSVKGYHGNGKRILSYKHREYKTWKYNRKTQYK